MLWGYEPGLAAYQANVLTAMLLSGPEVQEFYLGNNEREGKNCL